MPNLDPDTRQLDIDPPNRLIAKPLNGTPLESKVTIVQKDADIPVRAAPVTGLPVIPCWPFVTIKQFVIRTKS